MGVSAVVGMAEGAAVGIGVGSVFPLPVSAAVPAVVGAGVGDADGSGLTTAETPRRVPSLTLTYRYPEVSSTGEEAILVLFFQYVPSSLPVIGSIAKTEPLEVAP